MGLLLLPGELLGQKKEETTNGIVVLFIFIFIFYFILFYLFRATPMVHGDSKARVKSELQLPAYATASNARSELRL